MPNRARSGDVSNPERVVAPISVKGFKPYLHTACIWASIQHDIYFVIFHGRVEVLLHYGIEPMDFIYEKHVVIFQIGKQACQVAWLIQHWARSDFDA